MPVTEALTRNAKSIEKYNWPMEALNQMSQRFIPAEVYTNEQAKRFVANALLYFEQVKTPQQAFNVLGSDSNEHVSHSFVHGIDNVPGFPIKPRWRWFPLIDGFDTDNQPIYHTSTWSDDTTLKSMDLLRLDNYFSAEMRFFVPTAIVRPIQKEGGFGRGLQFTTVYEYQTSFARLRRQVTLESATEMYDAIRRDYSDWLALIGSRHRQSVEIYYRMLTPEWILEHLRSSVRTSPKSKEGVPSSGPGLQRTYPKILDFSQSTPYPVTDLANQASLLSQGQSSPWSTRPFEYSHAQLHQGSSSTTEQHNTVLQFDHRAPSSHIYLPVPAHLTPAQLDDSGSWLQLGVPLEFERTPSDSIRQQIYHRLIWCSPIGIRSLAQTESKPWRAA